MTDTSVEPSITVAGRRLAGRWPVVAFAVAVALVGLAFSQLLPLAVFVALRRAGVSLSVVPAITLQIVLTELVGFGGATWVVLRLRGRGFDYVHVRWPTLGDVAWMVGGSVLVLALYFGVVVSAALAGVPLAQSQIGVLGEGTPAILLVIAVLSVVLVGPMEELFFRGIVQETMREVLPARWAVLLASVTFAGIHYLTMVGPLVGKLVLLGSLLVTALVLGTAYERTQNLAVNAVVHGVYNAVLLLLAYVVLTSGFAGA